MRNANRLALTRLGFAFSVLLLATSTARSANNVDQTKIDFPASECVFAGKFTQTKTLQGLATPLQSSGAFYYHCQHGVIWSTTSPTNETLVLKRDGTGVMLVDSRTTKLKSRQSRFLGNLINDLMGANISSLKKSFVIERLSTTAQKYALTPKNRSLKRGIKAINIDMLRNDKLSFDSVVISILDRNAQQTEIRSIRDKVFSPTDEALPQCQLDTGLSQQSCARLLGRD